MVFGPPGAFGGKGAFGAAQGGTGAGGGGSGGFGYSPAQFGLTAPKGGYATPGGGTDPGSRGFISQHIAAKQKALVNTKPAADKSTQISTKLGLNESLEAVSNTKPGTLANFEARQVYNTKKAKAIELGYEPGAISHYNQINNMFTPGIFGNVTLALADSRDSTKHITVQKLGDMTTKQFNKEIGQNPNIGPVGDPDKGFGPFVLGFGTTIAGLFAPALAPVFTAMEVASNFSKRNPYTGSKRPVGLGLMGAFEEVAQDLLGSDKKVTGFVENSK